MITASISITNEVSSDVDDNIPSHWPTFEEVGGVRWDWDELSILSDSGDDEVQKTTTVHCPLHLVKEGHLVNNISVAGEDEGKKRHVGAVSSS